MQAVFIPHLQDMASGSYSCHASRCSSRPMCSMWNICAGFSVRFLVSRKALLTASTYILAGYPARRLSHLQARKNPQGVCTLRKFPRFQRVGFSVDFPTLFLVSWLAQGKGKALAFFTLKVTRKGFFSFSPVKLACVKRVILFDWQKKRVAMPFGSWLWFICETLNESEKIAALGNPAAL